jgi:hypothetical protein
VYGDDRRWRLWLEAQPQADALAVSGTAYVWWGGRQRQVNTVLAAPGGAGGPRLAPRAAGAAPYQCAGRAPRLCGLGAPGHDHGRGGARGRGPLDHGEQL